MLLDGYPKLLPSSTICSIWTFQAVHLIDKLAVDSRFSAIYSPCLQSEAATTALGGH